MSRIVTESHFSITQVCHFSLAYMIVITPLDPKYLGQVYYDKYYYANLRLCVGNLAASVSTYFG